MRIKKAPLILAAVVAFVVSIVPVVAQQAPAPAAPQASSASGQLVRVDTTAKTLAIRSDKGEMLFSYTDATKVTGEEQSVAGLATMKDAEVTVTFTRKGQENIASQIEVHKKRPA